MRCIAVAVLAAGCGFHPAAAPAADAARDASPGRDVAQPDGAMVFPDCYGDALAMVCIAPPTQDLTIGTAMSAETMCVSYSSPQTLHACVIAGKTISVLKGGSLRATSAPLILVSPGMIDIAGTLDVSSTQASPGGGHDVGMCDAPGAAGDGTDGGGGGAGGSFGGKGGDGGDGGSGGHGSATDALEAPTELRGGCPGGAGSLGAAGGSGGGAVMVASRMAIEVHGSGVINASGAGGAGGVHDATHEGGAGGGGAGGMIVLDAPTIALDNKAAVFANGGGGGEGADNSADGNPGSVSAGPDMAGGGGGSNTFDGGNGGDGAYGSTVSGAVHTDGTNGGDYVFSPAGGGGGGGGAGVIRLFGNASGSNQVAPPAN